MRRALTSIVLLSCVIGPAGAQSSYYDWNGSSPAPRPPRAEEPEPTKPRKVFIVEGATAPSAPRASEQGAQLRLDEQGNAGGTGGDHVALPPNMERGVRDLEAGMEDLRVYTAEMAVHIQRNGLRGFLAVPPEIKQKGNAIGKQIGHGVNGITTDVGKEMVAPERH